jgi:hypothetical protein
VNVRDEPFMVKLHGKPNGMGDLSSIGNPERSLAVAPAGWLLEMKNSTLFRKPFGRAIKKPVIAGVLPPRCESTSGSGGTVKQKLVVQDNAQQ